MNAKKRPQLTKHAIVDAAIRLADRDGLAKLSMRNLAAELGFEVMSLYTHVSNKADVHTSMVERSVEQLELPDIDNTFSWRAALREHALDLRALFERHPWLVDLWVGSIPGPRRFDLMEWQLAAFAVSGLSEEDAHVAYHAFFNHTVGYMLQRFAMTYAGDEAAIAKMIATLEPDRHTHVLQHVDQHRNGDIGDSFEYTLDLLLGSYH
jgi:AcrR family transcriptional regulator